MDKVYLKDLISAIKAELVGHRVFFVIFFLGVTFAVLVLGVIWPKTYTTKVMLVADVTSIIEPLLKGQAEVSKIDRSEQAKEYIYARSIMESVAKERKLINSETSAEKIGKVVEEIRNGLTIKKENNNYFRLSYESNDPDRSFEMLNTIISVFIADTEKKKRDESQGAFKFIDAQVQSYKHQLELAEEKLKEFNAQNVDGNEASVMARINQLRIDIESLKITIEESQARVNTLQQQLGAEGQYQHAKGQTDELKVRRQTLNEALARLRLSYEDSYPDIVSLRSQIAELDASISKMKVSGDVFGNGEKIENPLYEELRKQLSVAEVELRGQRRRMESLIGLQKLEHERAQRVAANQAEYSELNRDYDVTRKQYEDMLLRKGQARLSMTLDVEGQGISYRIQEPATFPLKPSGLSFIHFALAGPWIGALLPLMLLIVFIMVDPHIRSARALHNQLPSDVEILGVVPHYHSPIGDRLLRKDMVVLLGLSLIGIAGYIAFAIYWQILKG
jgi:polysaccharide chain length determinant protein (PEP-CTERM system associated)